MCSSSSPSALNIPCQPRQTVRSISLTHISILHLCVQLFLSTHCMIDNAITSLQSTHLDSRTCELITGTRTHFSPIYLQLDMRQARHWQMKSSPDVLVFPSKLTALVKEIGGRQLMFKAKYACYLCTKRNWFVVFSRVHFYRTDIYSKCRPSLSEGEDHSCWNPYNPHRPLSLPRIISLSLFDVGTLVINPGQLVKESYGGTFASLTIHPLNEAELRDAKIAGKEDLPHSVCSRSSVTIQKI